MESTSPTLPAELSPILARSHIAETPMHWIGGGQVPPPYQGLLVHDHDMTSALEGFHAEPISLEILQSEQDGELYLREVVLHAATSGKPVEYGVIEILLDSFPEDLRPLILDGHLPLGQILNESGLPYRSEPQGFFSVLAADLADLADLFPASAGGEILYGRYNHLIRADNSKTLAKILEILPLECGGRVP